ncbi:peroxiredoxin, SACOL1771 subfamily [Salinibacillus kushneri]|uniref:Peroxiredoxin, SACOL1771 subfamily n=1 Tax=Salinibacillus kushneri TaxID=237682 RepID=A0A1I0CQE4_9BACI|nr:OsmC family protein [Salinibacillus kushneri]SET21742.1 peroxiredoxin, SACOL1771 subfamily [Salinibacillus kushneri]
MAEHTFKLKADWPGGRNNVGEIDAGNLKTKISIPPEMDGPGVGTNPDEMLLGAAATCYIITLGAMIERANLPLDKMELDSEGMVDVSNGIFTYKKIIHKPNISLQSHATDKDLKLLKKLAEKAETNCMISKAIKGNVELELDPTLTIRD